MRILVLGAGGVGGYFGGRLAQTGASVTFLVRQGRAAQLAQDGLVVESRFGRIALPPSAVSAITAATAPEWDLVLLSCKAYDLDTAIAAVAPALGPDTLLLPLLNGLAHIDRLDAAFGAARVMPGVAYIAATLEPSGVVRHLNDVHRLGFGARDGAHPPVLQALAEALDRAKVEARLLDDPIQALWDKWTMLAPLAAMTCLMRAPVGPIVAAGGTELMRGAIAEVVAIAAAARHAPGSGIVAAAEKALTAPGSAFAASMLRDIARDGPTEAAHVVGDLVARAAATDLAVPLLRTAWVHLQVYEAARRG
jgi:2-dehydropantoate 2-reductase